MTKNLGQFIKKAAEKYQDKTALEIKRGIRVDRFSFSQIFEFGSKLAAFLDQKGLKKGEKVVVLAPNMPEYVLTFFGSWLRGVVVVPIDVRTTKETIEKFVKLTQPKLGFTSKYLSHPFASFDFPTYFLEDLVGFVSGEKYPRCRSYCTSKVLGDDVAEIVFTSGTTGTPKGVILSHRNLLFDIERVLEVFPLDSSWRILSVLPLSHAFAQVVDLLACFSRGMKVIYLPRTNTATLKKALKKHRVTCMATVPLMLNLMLKNIKQEAEDKGKLARFGWAQRIAPSLPVGLRRLLFREVHRAFGGKFQFFVCGSAPLDLSLARAWENMGIDVYEGYGATEMTAGLSLNTPQVKKLGSVGEVLPGMKVKIAQDGEIWAQGENVSPGYFKNPRKTKEAFIDGWYRSGDVGFIDEDGFLHILGRTAFKIVLPSGLKVYPEDVERKLKNHFLVEEACVVGVKRGDGEVVHAVVITPQPQMLDKIIGEVNGELGDHQRIFEASVWLGEDFPRTPVLKIDRKKVLEWVERRKLKTHPEPEQSPVRDSPDTVRLSRTGSGQNSKLKTGEVNDEVIEILAKVSGVSAGAIKEETWLGRDLKLDSLARIELVSLIEERLNVGVEEQRISDRTRVKDLRGLVEEGRKVQEREWSAWPFAKLTQEARDVFQRFLVFPPHGFFVKLEVKNKKNLARFKPPAIFVFNHLGPYDALCLLRILPVDLRKKLIVLADTQDWKRAGGGVGLLIQSLAGGLPITHRGKVIRAGLEQVGDLVADGFSTALAPEGRFSKTGRLGEFKPGVGMLALELKLPVMPIKIDPDYQKIFRPTPFGKWQNYLPKRRGKVNISVGKPLVFSKETSYIKVTEKVKEEMEQL